MDAARACTNMSAHASQTQTGTYGHVGLVARAGTNTSTHASQTQARTQHKPPSWRLPGGLRLLSSGILGGSLFSSWTGEPHRGLGRLFVRKRTRWPHLWARTPRPSGLMEPRPQGLRPWQPLPHHAHAHHPFLVASISAKNGLCMPRRQRRRREACALELSVASDHGRFHG